VEYVAIYAALAVALPLTVWSLGEAVRARAWSWLVSMVLLWPVGVIAWFVAGRRFYEDVAPNGPPPPPVTAGPQPPRASR
jgi:hypothetical protein